MATKLYVGNLNFRTTDAVLGQAFEAAGLTVVSAKVIVDRETGRSRGFAFVDVDPKHAVGDVLRLMHGRDVEGRPLNVTEARERDRPPMGGPRMGPRIGPPVSAQRPSPGGHRPEFSHEAPYRPARPVHDFARPPMGGGGHMPSPADLLGTDVNDGRNRDSRRERREYKGSRQQARDDDDDDY